MSGENALKIVQTAKDKGALVFANMENLEAKVDLYRTEVTELTFKKEEFHDIQGKMMPSKAVTDRIGEAFGVQFIESACRVIAENRDDPTCGKRTVYRAEAQGKVRMPDGSWRLSTVDEYEFDPVLRAMLDKNVTELTEATRKNIGRTILEYSKVARQRAATGARLRVIRQLTGMPPAFSKDEFMKPMVFTRIAQNTSYILQTPEGRVMATAQALGMDVSTLFGDRKLPDPASVQPEGNPPADERPPDDIPPEDNTADMAAQAEAAEEPDFPEEPTGPETTVQEETEFARQSHTLDQIMMSYKTELDVVTKTGKNPYKLAEEELKNTAATEETRRAMNDRLIAFLKAKGINV
jgi:hypothetical protein